jgi:DNA helicase-2/ATP-dependent DNA helicase PcrA
VNPADTLALARAIDRPPRGLAALERALRAGRLRTLDDCACHGPALLARRSARTHLGAFVDLQRDLTGAATRRSPAAVLAEVIARTDYARWLGSAPDGAARRGNVERLAALAAASDAEDLGDFLAEVAGAPREADLPDRDGVVLSTIHRAKGLEFPVVFVVGMAEELLPHRRSIGDPDARAEEARCAYVAATRARDRLYLSVPLALERDGRRYPRASSRFLEPLRGKRLRVLTV